MPRVEKNRSGRRGTRGRIGVRCTENHEGRTRLWKASKAKLRNRMFDSNRDSRLLGIARTVREKESEWVVLTFRMSNKIL